jgi:hypothetical protein
MKSTLKINLVFMVVFGLTMAAGAGAEEPAYSGFLSDYSQLKPDPAKKVDLIFMASANNLKAYTKFIFARVMLHFAPDARGTTVNPTNLKKLTDYFHGEIVKALSATGRYHVVGDPGPGVLRIRAAITDIKKTTSMLNILPQTKLTGLGLDGASFEAEAVDSLSGERLGAVVDSAKGTRLSTSAGLKTFGDAEHVMKEWAEDLVERLDEVHGYEGQ